MKPDTSRPSNVGNTEDQTTSRGNPRYFWISAFGIFTMLATSNLATPLYREYAEAFRFSPLTLTLIFSVYVCAMVPSLLIFGPLSDAIGKRKVLTWATVLAICSMGLFALATATKWLLFARLLQGIAVGAASGALTASLSEFEPRKNRNRAALTTTIASLGGLGAGPLIAGFLAQYGPARFVLPYVAGLALLIPLLIFVHRFPDTGVRMPWRPRKPSIPRNMLRTFVLNSVASFAAFSVLGLFLALVPSIVSDIARTKNLLFAGAAVSLMLLSSMVAQWLSFGKNTLKLQRNGLLTLAVGLSLLLGAAHTSSLKLLLLASISAGVGHGLAFLGGITEVNLKAPATQHAEVVSSYYVIVYLGLSIPVVAVGFLALHYGLPRAVQLFSYAVIPLCLLMATILHKHAANE